MTARYVSVVLRIYREKEGEKKEEEEGKGRGGGNDGSSIFSTGARFVFRSMSRRREFGRVKYLKLYISRQLMIRAHEVQHGRDMDIINRAYYECHGL